MVPFSGCTEHDPPDGSWLIMKFKALELVSEAKSYSTSKRHRVNCGLAKNQSSVDVKLLVFPPEQRPRERRGSVDGSWEEWERCTEEPSICVEMPFGQIDRCIGRAVIDIPSDIQNGRATANTQREQSHLCWWIDQLIFSSWETQRGNGTTEVNQSFIVVLSWDSDRYALTYPMAMIGEDLSSTRTRRKPTTCEAPVYLLLITTMNWYVWVDRSVPPKTTNEDLMDKGTLSYRHANPLPYMIREEPVF